MLQYISRASAFSPARLVRNIGRSKTHGRPRPKPPPSSLSTAGSGRFVSGLRRPQRPSAVPARSRARFARVIYDGEAAATPHPTGRRNSAARRKRPPEWLSERLGPARNGSLVPPSDALVQSATQTVRVGLQLHSATNRVIFNYTFAQALSHLREPFPIREQWIALKAMCWLGVGRRLLH